MFIKLFHHHHHHCFLVYFILAWCASILRRRSLRRISIFMPRCNNRYYSTNSIIDYCSRSMQISNVNSSNSVISQTGLHLPDVQWICVPDDFFFTAGIIWSMRSVEGLLVLLQTFFFKRWWTLFFFIIIVFSFLILRRRMQMKADRRERCEWCEDDGDHKRWCMRKDGPIR